MRRTRAAGLVAAFAATALALTACGSSTSGSGSSSSTSSSSSSDSSSSAATGASSAPAGSSTASSSGSGSASGSTSGSASSGSGSATAGGGGAPGSVVIGSANFSESELLMNIYADALKAKGVTVSLKPAIGSREVYLPALKDGSIDLIPEYTGVLLAYFDKNSTATSSEDIYKALPAAVGPDLKVLDQAKAEDKDSITVSAETASKYNLKSIGDLKSVAGDLTLGAPPEFKTRADGIPGLKAKYGVEFGDFKTLDAGGPLTVNALKNGQIDAGDLFTTDPAIEANKFVVLQDPENLYTAQNIVPLINAAKSTPTIEAALNAVSAKLETTTLVDLNAKVGSGSDPATVAADWVKSQGLG
ncbi:ABC transporter substrate-binding protein [Nakamurella endophytica]|uniref:ABC-type glycine betaine transport system substrate-binding domain-containing protein n=1 Tax=Nakamurella endophytica TaxID=1748367 RepID=A0A917SZG7_9ACTN|nr:ABC transporter substrate-binding protein [Nakamurella endophytica]GGM03647.1 hypothetical protein GCM10011594_24790 [Nakamurella endophytica]